MERDGFHIAEKTKPANCAYPVIEEHRRRTCGKKHKKSAIPTAGDHALFMHCIVGSLLDIELWRHVQLIRNVLTVFFALPHAFG